MLNHGQAGIGSNGFFPSIDPAGLNEIVEVLETPSDAVLTSTLTASRAARAGRRKPLTLTAGDSRRISPTVLTPASSYDLWSARALLTAHHRRAALLPCHGAGILASSHEQPALDTHPSIRTSEASP